MVKPRVGHRNVLDSVESGGVVVARGVASALAGENVTPCVAEVRAAHGFNEESAERQGANGVKEPLPVLEGGRTIVLSVVGAVAGDELVVLEALMVRDGGRGRVKIAGTHNVGNDASVGVSVHVLGHP